MEVYHASSYLKQNSIISNNTKENRQELEYISSLEILSYDAFYGLLYELVKEEWLKNTGKDAIKWCSEAIFESVRRKRYFDMPSRLWGMFVLPNYESAIEFAINHNRHYVFEINTEAKVKSFDMNLFTKADELFRGQDETPAFTEFSIFEIELSRRNITKQAFEYALASAERYWKREEKPEISEYLFYNPEIEIGKIVYTNRNYKENA